MTKAEFIGQLKDVLPEIFETKASAEKVYVTFCDILAKAIASGKSTRLTGVGTFAVTHRAPRTGRNPRTGTAIRIPARKAVKFSPAKSLAEKVRK